MIIVLQDQTGALIDNDFTREQQRDLVYKLFFLSHVNVFFVFAE